MPKENRLTHFKPPSALSPRNLVFRMAKMERRLLNYRALVYTIQGSPGETPRTLLEELAKEIGRDIDDSPDPKRFFILLERNEDKDQFLLTLILLTQNTSTTHKHLFMGLSSAGIRTSGDMEVLAGYYQLVGSSTSFPEGEPFLVIPVDNGPDLYLQFSASSMNRLIEVNDPKLLQELGVQSIPAATSPW